MNSLRRHITQSIFDRKDVEEISLEELDQAMARYPFFSVLHYLRAARLKATDDGAADGAIDKAALYFPNPLWLQYQLSRKEETEDDHEEEPLAEISASASDLEVPELRESDQIPVASMVQEEMEAGFDEGAISETEQMYGADAVHQDPGLQGSEEATPVAGIVTHEIDEPIPAIEVFDIPAPEDVPDEIIPAVEDVKAAPAEVPAMASTGPSEPEDPVIPLEPLYTIDYFASQGIRLPVEENKQDQLSVKLKSFTEWLKSMKKIHPEKIDKQMDQQTEQVIRASAEYSNERGDLYTESLAEVYVKQGLTERAVEVYKKLSLLDPAKSAYFAARIREIKDN